MPERERQEAMKGTLVTREGGLAQAAHERLRSAKELGTRQQNQVQWRKKIR